MARADSDTIAILSFAVSIFTFAMAILFPQLEMAEKISTEGILGNAAEAGNRRRAKTKALISAGVPLLVLGLWMSALTFQSLFDALSSGGVGSTLLAPSFGLSAYLSALTIKKTITLIIGSTRLRQLESAEKHSKPLSTTKKQGGRNDK